MEMTFTQFAQSHGLIVPRVIEGKWVRVRTTDKPKHRNGAYKYLGDVGFIQNWATMQEPAVWRPTKPHAYQATTPRVGADGRARIRAEQLKQQAHSIHAMREHWESLPSLADGHPYLKAKGLSMQGCNGLRIDGDLLVIPVYRNASLISLQTIAPDGTKRYRYGCPIKGGNFVLNRRSATLTAITEGFATGLAVYQCIPVARVIVCFDAGNMAAVARALNVTGLAVVCADNDWQTEARTGSNPGIERARQAADAIGCGIAYPQGIQGTDWADALQEYTQAGSEQGQRHPQAQAAARVKVEIMKEAKPIFKR